jgi:prevent-host-death family protein
MDLPHWSLQDAKNSFSAVVDAAMAGVPQMVTKRGKPAAVVLSAEAYERMTGSLPGERKWKSFTEALLAMPQDDGEFPVSDLALRDVEF